MRATGLAKSLMNTARTPLRLMFSPKRLLEERGIDFTSEVYRSANKFTVWGWHTGDTWHGGNRTAVRFWSAIIVTFCGLTLRDLEGPLNRAFMCVLIVLALCMALLTHTALPPKIEANAHMLASRIMVSFAILQAAMTVSFTYSYANGYSIGRSLHHICSCWLDIIIHNGISLSVFALTDITCGWWLAFLVMHLFVSTDFLMVTIGNSMPLAIFKVLCTHGFGLYIVFTMERSKCRMCIKEKEAKDKGLFPGTKGASSSKSMTASTSASIGGVQAKSVPDPHTHPGHTANGSKAKTTQKPRAQAGREKAAGYESRMRRTKVMLKIHSDRIEPGQLNVAVTTKLLRELAKKFPGICMQEGAARLGCVVLSMDLCELQQLSDQHCGGKSVSTRQAAREVVLSWLKHSNLADQLPDGTVLDVQVEDAVFSYVWYTRDWTWEPQDMSPSSCATLPQTTEDAVSISLPEMAIMLPYTRSDAQLQLQSTARSVQVSFSAHINTPPHTTLVGWRESRSHAVPEPFGRTKLQLLARAHGQFLPVTIEKAGSACGELQEVQLSVSVPSSFLAPDFCCSVKLEIMRDSAILCGCNALLVASQLCNEAEELYGWIQSTRATTDAELMFANDLADWLSWHSLFHQTLILPQNYSITTRNSASSDGSNMDSAAAGVADLNKMLPVLIAEASQAEMVHMMSEVGLDLLQYAVNLGMPAIASRVLLGMMAAPINMPFYNLATGQLPPKKEESGQAPVTDQQPHLLLTYAMLSLHANTIAKVLAWGAEHGGPDFCWNWHAVDGSGNSPIQVVQRLPVGHEIRLLLHLVIDLDVPQPAACVQTARPTSVTTLAIAGPTSVTSLATAAAITPSAPTAASGSSSSHALKEASSQVHFPSDSALSLERTTCFKEAVRVMLRGFGDQQSHNGVSEAAYRAWRRDLNATVAKTWCCGFLLVFCVSAAQCFLSFKNVNGGTMLVYMAPSLLAQVCGSKEMREFFMICAAVSHWSLIALFGMGVVPTVVARKGAMSHIDWIFEVILYRLIAQVQLPVLLLERTVATVCITMLYTQLEISHPFLRALAINVGSLLVGVCLDHRNRCAFLKERAAHAAKVK